MVVVKHVGVDADGCLSGKWFDAQCGNDCIQKPALLFIRTEEMCTNKVGDLSVSKNNLLQLMCQMCVKSFQVKTDLSFIEPSCPSRLVTPFTIEAAVDFTKPHC